MLVLDRGYPAAWLVAYLTENKIRFCMRCDKNNGWTAMRALICSGQPEARVALKKPSRRDAADYLCSGAPTQVRLVRLIAPDGQIRVVATNLPAQDFPVAVFGELYHQRWRIEEAFKRLKHRAKLESVSGLSQHALLVDVFAKVLADNLGSLVCQAASESARLLSRQRTCNSSLCSALPAAATAAHGHGLGLSECLAGQSHWIARGQFSAASPRSISAQT
ncbi:transposase [Polaromonas sp.]|uniref:transposase n=1 Tax=Polaromonas sp. TaxID=1869339 RepID=UPI003BB69346